MKRRLTVPGTILLVLALAAVIFLCADTRIDPQIRKSYETSMRPASENEDMNLLLQMLNSGDTKAGSSAAEENPDPAGTVNRYGLMLGAASFLSFLLFAMLLPREKRPVAPLAMALSLLLGIVFARILFWLVSLCNGQLHGFASVFRIYEGGLSMTGALLGACLGCLAAARILNIPVWTLADAMAPAAALFIACERCHEWVLLKQNYGLEASSLHIFSAQGTYGPVLNTSRISGLTALVILFILLLVRKKRSGDRALLFLFLYGVTQILFESLRQDHHMQWNFVYFQQIFAAAAALLAVLMMSGGTGKKIRALIVTLLMACAAIALEFALDGRIPPPFAFMAVNVKLCWYIVFILVLAVYLVFGLCRYKTFRKEEVCG